MRAEGLLRKSLTGESIRSKVCEERVKSEGEVLGVPGGGVERVWGRVCKFIRGQQWELGVGSASS